MRSLRAPVLRTKYGDEDGESPGIKLEDPGVQTIRLSKAGGL
jgi:hypothetical protein